MLNDRDRYIEEIEEAFQAQTEKEKEYIELLIRRIFDYSNDHDCASYEDYIEFFGSPNEIVLAYFENTNTKESIRKTKKQPWLKLIYFVVIVCIIIYSFFAFASFLEGRNHYIGGYNETIIE